MDDEPDDELSRQELLERIFGCPVTVVCGHPEDYIDEPRPVRGWLYSWLDAVGTTPALVHDGAVRIDWRLWDRLRCQDAEAVDAAAARLLEEHGVRVEIG